MKAPRQHNHHLYPHKSRQSIHHKAYQSNRTQLKDINILTNHEHSTNHEITHFDMDTPSKYPMDEFSLWYAHAVNNEQNETIAFSLPTINSDI